MLPSRYWADLPWPAFRTLPPETVAVLPIAAIEQHGPHLPVSTDWVTATSAAEAATSDAVAAGVSAVLLPGLSYTKSDEHAAFPGTLWLSHETLMATLVDVGRSLVTSGITRLLFVNGHGGNSALGQVACRELRRRFGLRTFLAHLAVPADQGGRGGGAPSEHGMGVHGGHGETSLMLHLRPELVRMDLATPRVPHGLRDFELIGFGRAVSFGWTSDDFGPDGHIGDPTGATAEHGKLLFEAAVEHLARVVAEASRFDVAGAGGRA